MFYGNHDLKAGFMYTQAGVSRYWESRSRGTGKTDNLTSGNYELVFRGGVPFQIGARNQPVRPYNEDHHTSFFVKDSWTIARRLTANLGLRFDRDNGVVPAQCREAGDWPFFPEECFAQVQLAIWNAFAPRLHLSYDVTGDGKTVLKGGWARFNHMRDVQPEIDQHNRNVYTTMTFLWRDLNRNNTWDPGETNLDPNGSDFVSIAGYTAEIPNLDLKQPKADEFSLSIEREVMANMGLRITGIYSRDFNTNRLAGVQQTYESYNIPITNPDPGPDGNVGTADDPGTFVTYWEFPATLAGFSNSNTISVNPGSQTDQTYKSFEIAVAKRLADRWQLNGSYSSTWLHVPFGTNRLPLNPNAEIFTANDTREWLGRLSGAYIFPWDITGSAIFEHRSGTPLARQVQFRGGRTIPNIVVNVEPLGSIRTPNLNTLDLRASKSFNVGRGQRMEFRVNMFNALNINDAITLNVRSGPNFMIPTSIVLPRVVDFSVLYRF
jgi:TonB dependent receptor-like, beta-barrel